MYAVRTASVRFCSLFFEASVREMSADILHSATQLSARDAQLAGGRSGRRDHETAADCLQIRWQPIQDKLNCLSIFRASETRLMRFRRSTMVAVFGRLSRNGIARWCRLLTWWASMRNGLPLFTTPFADQHEHFGAENALDECVD